MYKFKTKYRGHIIVVKNGKEQEYTLGYWSEDERKAWLAIGKHVVDYTGSGFEIKRAWLAQKTFYEGDEGYDD